MQLIIQAVLPQQNQAVTMFRLKVVHTGAGRLNLLPNQNHIRFHQPVPAQEAVAIRGTHTVPVHQVVQARQGVIQPKALLQEVLLHLAEAIRQGHHQEATQHHRKVILLVHHPEVPRVEAAATAEEAAGAVAVRAAHHPVAGDKIIVESKTISHKHKKPPFRNRAGK